MFGCWHPKKIYWKWENMNENHQYSKKNEKLCILIAINGNLNFNWHQSHNVCMWKYLFSHWRTSSALPDRIECILLSFWRSTFLAYVSGRLHKSRRPRRPPTTDLVWVPTTDFRSNFEKCTKIFACELLGGLFIFNHKLDWIYFTNIQCTYLFDGFISV